MPRTRVLSALIAVGLVLSACSDDADEGAGDDGTSTTEASDTEDAAPDDGGGGGDDRQGYVDVTAELLTGALPLQDDEAACFAAALVDAIDFETFVEAGISPDELRTSGEQLEDLDLDIEDGMADRFGENLGPCAIDYASVLLTFAGPSEATQPGIDCVNAQLDREQLDQLLAVGATSGFTGVEPETDLRTVAQPALDACADEISGAGG